MLSNLRFGFSYVKLLSGAMMCCPARRSLHVSSAMTACLGGTVMAHFSCSMLFLLCSCDFVKILTWSLSTFMGLLFSSSSHLIIILFLIRKSHPNIICLFRLQQTISVYMCFAIYFEFQCYFSFCVHAFSTCISYSCCCHGVCQKVQFF